MLTGVFGALCVVLTVGGCLLERVEPVVALCVAGGVGYAVVCAAGAWEQARRGDPAVDAALLRLNDGHAEEAVATLRRLLDQRETGPRAAALAAALSKQGNWLEAADAHARARVLEPELPVHSINQAMALWNAGGAPRAIEVAAAERRASPQDAAVAFCAAYLLARTGRYEEAREHYRQGAELAEMAERVQRVDPAVRTRLWVLCQQALGDVATRGFEVIPLAQVARATDATVVNAVGDAVEAVNPPAPAEPPRPA